MSAKPILELTIHEIVNQGRYLEAMEHLNDHMSAGSSGVSKIPRPTDTLQTYLLTGWKDKAEKDLESYAREQGLLGNKPLPLMRFESNSSIGSNSSKRSLDELNDKATEMVSVPKNSRRRKSATGSAQSTPTSTSSSVLLTPNGKLLQTELNNLIADKESVKAMERQLARKRNIYTNTNLKDHLFGMTSDNIYTCTIANIDIYNNMISRSFRPTPPSDRTFSSDFSKAVSWKRTAEGHLAPRPSKPIDNQCNYSIGEPISEKTADMDNRNVMGSIGLQRTIHNFREWDRHYCWLCSLPLWVGGQKAQCEHKLPILEMIIFGAGLAGSVDEQANIIASQRQHKKIRRKSFSQEWKNLMRGEAYGWSHTWCNMYKNQLPFMTMRSNEKDDGTYQTFPFMEMNTIYSYVEQSFINTFLDTRKPATKIEDIIRVTNLLRKEFNRHYNLKLDHNYFNNVSIDRKTRRLVDNNPEKLIYTRRSRQIDTPIFNNSEVLAKFDLNGNDDVTTKAGNLIPMLKQSFEGIIQLLSPTVLYMTSGSDVPGELKVDRDNILKDRRGGQRGMFINRVEHIGGGGIDNYTTFQRAKDNYERYAIALNIPSPGDTALEDKKINNFIDFLKTPYPPDTEDDDDEGTRKSLDKYDGAPALADIFKTTVGFIEGENRIIEEEKKRTTTTDDDESMESDDDESMEVEKDSDSKLKTNLHTLVQKEEIDLNEKVDPVTLTKNEINETLIKMSQEIVDVNAVEDELERRGSLREDPLVVSRQNSFISSLDVSPKIVPKLSGKGAPPEVQVVAKTRLDMDTAYALTEGESMDSESGNYDGKGRMTVLTQLSPKKKTGTADENTDESYDDTLKLFSDEDEDVDDETKIQEIIKVIRNNPSYTQAQVEEIFPEWDRNLIREALDEYNIKYRNKKGGKKKKRKRKTKKRRKKRKRTKRKKKKKKTKKRRKRKRKTRRKGRRKR